MTRMFVPPRQHVPSGSRHGPVAPCAERRGALEPRKDETPGDASLAPAVLHAAIKADPANRFFLSVVAAAAAGSMIAALFHDERAALITSIVVFQGAVVMSVFSRLNRLEQNAFHWPALTLLWVTMLAFIATLIFVVSSSFFDWPLRWKDWLNALAVQHAVVGPPADVQPDGRALTSGTGKAPDVHSAKDINKKDNLKKTLKDHRYPAAASLAAVVPAPVAARASTRVQPAALAIQGDSAFRVPFASPFSQRLTVAGDHGPLRWSLASEGQGLAIDTDGMLRGTLSAPSVRELNVRVADGAHAVGERHLTLPGADGVREPAPGWRGPRRPRGHQPQCRPQH